MNHDLSPKPMPCQVLDNDDHDTDVDAVVLPGAGHHVGDVELVAGAAVSDDAAAHDRERRYEWQKEEAGGGGNDTRRAG